MSKFKPPGYRFAQREMRDGEYDPECDPRHRDGSSLEPVSACSPEGMVFGLQARLARLHSLISDVDSGGLSAVARQPTRQASQIQRGGSLGGCGADIERRCLRRHLNLRPIGHPSKANRLLW